MARKSLKKSLLNSKKKKREKTYKTFFIAGLISIIWEINIYRNTIIDLWILFTIIIFVGVIGVKPVLKDFQDLFNYKYKALAIFWSFIQSSVSYGFLICTFLMASNYYFASERVSTKNYEIIDRYSMAGSKQNRDKRKPVFKVKINNKIKDLVFGNEYFTSMESYQFVQFETRTGLFGFDIIENKRLK